MVDCGVSNWGPWSACDADCGSGTMYRSRTIQTQPRNGGRRCPSLQQRRGCQVGNCAHHHGANGEFDQAARGSFSSFSIYNINNFISYARKKIIFWFGSCQNFNITCEVGNTADFIINDRYFSNKIKIVLLECV